MRLPTPFGCVLFTACDLSGCATHMRALLPQRPSWLQGRRADQGCKSCVALCTAADASSCGSLRWHLPYRSTCSRFSRNAQAQMEAMKQNIGQHPTRLL